MPTEIRRPPSKRGPGNQPFVATKEQRAIVSALVSAGLDRVVIARTLHVSRSTLSKYFKKELKEGRDYIEGAVTYTVVQQALKGKLAACFFLLKTRFGWRETNQHAFLGSDGKPISFQQLDNQSLNQLLAALRASLGDPADRGDPATAGAFAGDEGGEGDMDPESGTTD